MCIYALRWRKDMNFRCPLSLLAGLGIVLAFLTIDQWIFGTWFNTTHIKCTCSTWSTPPKKLLDY
jgi:hypothetical protein